MNLKLKRLIEQSIPFIVLGITAAFAIGLLVVFSYVLLYGVIIGAIIWAVVAIKAYLFPSYPAEPTSEGRIIEHEDKKKKD